MQPQGLSWFRSGISHRTGTGTGTGAFRVKSLCGNLTEIVVELERLATETGDPRCRRAAGLLRAEPGQRKPIDNQAALLEARGCTRAGPSRHRRGSVPACRADTENLTQKGVASRWIA